MSDSSFSDQVSGFSTENNDDDNEPTATATGNSAEAPEFTETPQGTSVDTVEAMETATTVNTAYVPLDEDEEEAVEATLYEGEPKTVEQEYVYKAHMDAMRQKDPHGTYGDDVARRQAEVQRARVEGREPDFDNMGPTVGDVVITKQQAENMSTPEPVRGVPVAFTADVVIGQPEVTDAEGNVPEEDNEED